MVFTGAWERNHPEQRLVYQCFSCAMMVHSRWFDKIQPEDENINGRARCTGTQPASPLCGCERNYDPGESRTERLCRCQNCTEVYNYSQFLPIAKDGYDENGEIHATTGKGSLHVTVLLDDLYGEGMMDVRKTDVMELTLDT